MQPINKYFVIVVFILFIVSCSDETIVFEQNDDSFSLEQNPSVLENSVSFQNSGVLGIFNEQIEKSRSAKNNEEQATKYPITLVAQIAPPSFSGAENLTASDVHVDGDFAYVAYNTVEDGLAGAADIIDISDPNSPSVVSRVFSRSIDFNAIEYNDGYTYIVGGIDSEQSALAESNSLIIRISANGRFDTSDLLFGVQEGFTANDIAVVGDSAFMSSGKDGFITEFNKNTLEIINAAPYEDLRSVAIEDGKYVVLDASVGIRILNADLSEASQISIESDFRVADRRTLDLLGDRVIVAEGKNGAGVYSLSTGLLQEYIPITTNPTDVAESDIVTNATAFNEDVILMANGGGGLSLSEDNDQSINTVGVIELEGSINFVASKGDYIFAASGRSGLQIMKMNRPSDSLEAICDDAPEYAGSANLNVNSNEDFSYSGSANFNSLNINGNLLLCGSWASRNDVNINLDGILSVRGGLFVGRNNSNRAININNGGTLIIEGELVIFGDLRLGENTKLEFLGENSRVTVFGNVQIAGSASITGTFDDTEGKF